MVARDCDLAILDLAIQFFKELSVLTGQKEVSISPIEVE